MICIQIISWLVSEYNFYARVGKGLQNVILHNECIKKSYNRADYEVIWLLYVYRDQFDNDTHFLYKNTASKQNSNFMHQNVFINLQFLRNFVQWKLVILPKTLLHVECKNVLKFKNYVLNLASKLRRNLGKNVNKLPPKCHSTIFH